MRRILDRYVLREILTSSLAVTLVLLVILLTNEGARVLSRAADNQYPRGVVLELIGLGAVHDLVILVPIGLLLGLVLAFGRLYNDSEMTAAVACGAGPGRIYLPVVILGVLVTAILGWLSLAVGPAAFARVLALRDAAVRAGQFAPVTPGRFRTFAGGGTVVYAQTAAADGTLGNVFVERSREGRVEVALADRAHTVTAPDGQNLTITLYDCRRAEGVPGSARFRLLQSAQCSIPVQLPPLANTTDLDGVPTAQLLGSADRDRQAELQWRLALPVMGAVLAILAVPVSRLRPRQGRLGRVWLAVLLYIVYFYLLSAGRTALEHGAVPASIGLWWTHLAVVLAALAVLALPRALARVRHREVPA
ncbi:MAG TPA: LPS export ABC transporter permease LptF [Steroidobacteraceae bacterium]|nr:LPS export ABC transporter permease LptF [Steroidobacteraceae bacterium]